MAAIKYASNVFINCPFDDHFLELRNALIFAVFDCGFVPRCALEEDNSGNVRFEKIQRLINESKFGIHDISRTELDEKTALPRFNMPLELGVFIGAKCFGNERQKNKNCLILDKEQYRYQAFISDIAGHDIRSHNNDLEQVITSYKKLAKYCFRTKNNSCSGRKTIPGGQEIIRRYRLFEEDLPDMCKKIPIGLKELTYNDYTNFIELWLKENQ